MSEDLYKQFILQKQAKAANTKELISNVDFHCREHFPDVCTKQCDKCSFEQRNSK